MKAKLIKVEDVYRLVESTKHGNQIIATSDLDYQKTWSDRCQKLSKQNCDEIFGMVDVEKLAEEYGSKFAHSYDPEDFIAGFNKAMELNKDKVFTIDDMRKAFNQNPAQTNRPFNEFIQSLQQPTEIEVKIEMEDTFEKTSEVYTDEVGSGNYFSHSKKPKLDSEGCLILKKI